MRAAVLGTQSSRERLDDSERHQYPYSLPQSGGFPDIVQDHRQAKGSGRVATVGNDLWISSTRIATASAKLFIVGSEFRLILLSHLSHHGNRARPTAFADFDAHGHGISKPVYT